MVQRDSVTSLFVAAAAAALLGTASCAAPAAGPAAEHRAAVTATFLLPAVATGGATVLAVPKDAAQVVLRLAGEVGDVATLTAEIVPASAPDEARRWPVDAAPAADGAPASVTLPGYALQPGAYTVTLWQGDADVVRRYPVQVTRP